MSDRQFLINGEPGPAQGVSPFVGREAEMAWLLRYLAAAQAGHPHALLVIGEAGIGKTRLLREFGAAARARGVEVCGSRGYEDLHVPFLPAIEALGPRLRELPPAVEAALGAQAEVVRAFAVGGAGLSPAEPTDEEKLRLFLAVSRAVVELARLGPMLIILDDLHWVDQASLELFAHLLFTASDAAERSALPLLLIGATRPLAVAQQLARTVARFQREPMCRTLELGGLDEDRLRELVHGLGLDRPSQQLLGALRDATGGNPLFVQEVVRQLVRRGGASATALAGQGGPVSVPLPADVSGAIAARLHEVGAETRALLALAAVLGDPFRLTTLSAVGVMPEASVRAVLDEAAAQGLVVVDADSARFAHPLIRQVLYAELPAAVRQRRHAAIAAALVRQDGERSGEAALEIARHLMAAGPQGHAPTLLTYARQAGDHAFARASWRDAAGFYRAALAADDDVHALQPRERARLHSLAGQAHFRDQDAQPCLEQFGLAVAGFAACGDAHGHAVALVGRTRAELVLAAVPYGTLIDPEPLRAAAQAVATEYPGLSGLLWAELSQVYWTARRTADAAHAARHALAIGERHGYHFVCAEARRSLWLAQSQVMQVRDALASLEAGRADARLHGEAWVESELVQREPLTLTWLGRLDEAALRAEEAAELTRAVHDWGEHSLALGAMVCGAVARGDFAAAEQHMEQVLVMSRRSGYPWAGPTALPAIAGAHALRGRWEDAMAALDLLATPGELFAEPGPPLLLATYVYRSAVEAHAATTDAARTDLADRLRGLPAAPADAADVYALGVYGAALEVADLAGDAAAAAIWERPLALAAERGVVLATGWVFLVDRALGVIAMLARDWARAAAHYERALAAAEAMQARTEVARTAFDWARLLVARGRRRDRAQATTLAERAASLATELGLLPLERAAHRLGQRLAQPATASLPLTRREQALLDRLAHGCGDGEIAHELGLRAPLVGRSVTRLLHKLGLATRSEAAALLATPAPPVPLAPRPTGLRIIVFTDIQGSTSLFERLGDAAARSAVREHDDIVRACLRRHAGTELKHTGDGVMASFDSVADAMACAIAIQRALAQRNRAQPERAINVRIGINAGEPITEDGQLFGTSVNAAARICSQAQPGQILVADVVRSLASGKDVRFVDRGWFALRGLPARHHLHEVRW